MRTKPRDVPYCGVSRKKIASAHPTINEENLAHLFGFIDERYRIHLRKDNRRLDPPWTDNPILREYRFTNVRREHDRETRWLIDNIVKHRKATYEDKLLNIILFRLFNKHETMELIKAPINFSKYKPDRYRARLLSAQPNFVYFTGAFITGGMKRALKWYLDVDEDFMPMRVMYFMDFLNKSTLISDIKAAKTQKDVYDILLTYQGLGPFLAYQIFVDFTYIPEFPFSENEFTIAGPGCKRGLDNIFEDRDGLSYEEALFWLRDNIERLFKPFGWDAWGTMVDLQSHDRTLNVMSLENCMCEISKYIRAYNETGRPRVKYVPIAKK